jgi:ribosomal-protein-alanine N-acetyltransferase
MRLVSQATPAPPVKPASTASAIRVERYRESHFDQVFAIESQSFGTDSYNREFFQRLCEDNWEFTFVATRRDKVVGYIMGEHQPNSGEVVSLAVDRQYQGRGLGKKLLRRLLKRLRDEATPVVFLMVRVDNPVASKLYRDCGFQLVRRVPNYYTDGTTALRMKLRLL